MLKTDLVTPWEKENSLIHLVWKRGGNLTFTVICEGGGGTAS